LNADELAARPYDGLGIPGWFEIVGPEWQEATIGSDGNEYTKFTLMGGDRNEKGDWTRSITIKVPKEKCFTVLRQVERELVELRDRAGAVAAELAIRAIAPESAQGTKPSVTACVTSDGYRRVDTVVFTVFDGKWTETFTIEGSSFTAMPQGGWFILLGPSMPGWPGITDWHTYSITTDGDNIVFEADGEDGSGGRSSHVPKDACRAAFKHIEEEVAKIYRGEYVPRPVVP
jgi:hypothetical protein